MNESFCDKYGLTNDQAKKLLQDGVISYTSVERCEMKAHFERLMQVENYTKMEAVWHTSFHFSKSIRTVFRVIKT